MNNAELKKLTNEINEYKDLYNEMCDKCEDCYHCELDKFMVEHNCEFIPCEAIFMATHLLGFSEETSDFLKQQYKNKDKMCSKTKCSKCDMYTINRMTYHSNLICFEVYIASILLKDV